MSKRHVREEGGSPLRRPLVKKGRHRLPLVVGAVALVAGITATIFFWTHESGETARAYALAPESVLPADIRQAPARVREAYRFAVANREVLRWIPCYCGCGAQGHTSNASCYIKDASPPGNLSFDRMSLG